jgi:hypothetical protein
MCLLERTQGRAVCNIETGKIERSAEINTAFGVELRTVVRKCKKVSPQKGFETGPGCLHLRLRLGKPSLASHHVGQTPANFRIASADRRNEQRQCFARLAAARVDFS